MKTEHVIAETLTGDFAPLIPVMSDQVVLESMVTHLVRCTRDNLTTDCQNSNEKETTETTDFSMQQLELDGCYNDEDGGKMKWDSILKDILSRCPQLCTVNDHQLLKHTTIPLCAARWRETNDRQVLAPLDLTDNIIAGNLGSMSRKRKSDLSDDNSVIWIPNKCTKVEDAVNVKPCSVVVKRDPLNSLLFEFKNANRQPSVKLYDVFKEIPQTKQVEKSISKNGYMNFLNLNSKEPYDQKQAPPIKTSHPTKLSNYPQIPFSSDYGRLLLARERHCFPQDVALRKIDRMEWYLKGGTHLTQKNSSSCTTTTAATTTTTTTNNNNICSNFYNTYYFNSYNEVVVYDRKVRDLHTYKFPKRQFHQKQESLSQALARYVCKPVCVYLERMDISSYLEKPKKVKTNSHLAEFDPDVIEIISISDDEEEHDVAEMICIKNNGINEKNCIE